MGRRKVQNENVRKIQQSGGSYYVTIPIAIMRKLRWRERQKIVFAKRGAGITIKDWKK